MLLPESTGISKRVEGIQRVPAANKTSFDSKEFGERGFEGI